ncbi:hypothetical protein [Sulfurimonas sp.]
MAEVNKFTIKNATITINSATTLQFHSNKCDYIQKPFIICSAYRCRNYVLLFELAGYKTDKIIEPTREQFENETIDYDTPYFNFFYDELFDSFDINNDNNTFSLAGLYKDDEPVFYKKYNKGNNLERFHLFKLDDQAWTEVELDLNALYNRGLFKWYFFASGWIKKICENYAQYY